MRTALLALHVCGVLAAHDDHPPPSSPPPPPPELIAWAYTGLEGCTMQDVAHAWLELAGSVPTVAEANYTVSQLEAALMASPTPNCSAASAEHVAEHLNVTAMPGDAEPCGATDQASARTAWSGALTGSETESDKWKALEAAYVANNCDPLVAAFYAASAKIVSEHPPPPEPPPSAPPSPPHPPSPPPSPPHPPSPPPAPPHSPPPPSAPPPAEGLHPGEIVLIVLSGTAILLLILYVAFDSCVDPGKVSARAASGPTGPRRTEAPYDPAPRIFLKP